MAGVREFVKELEVRDYELDYQGIVNNAVYLNYLEHARSSADFLGGEVTAVRLQSAGITWVVSEIDIKFKQSLRAKEQFTVKTKCYLKGVMRIIFEQEIIRTSDNALIIAAVTTTACITNGRPGPFPPIITDVFKD
jgi:acyl-CoA thioester hydrolase